MFHFLSLLAMCTIMSFFMFYVRLSRLNKDYLLTYLLIFVVAMMIILDLMVTVSADIDECARWADNRCSQLCVNVKGSYKCRCHDGFSQVATSSLATCKANGKNSHSAFTVVCLWRHNLIF